jgi:hypothetical protein
MKNISLAVTAAVIICGTLMVCAQTAGYFSGLLAAPIVFAPLFLNFPFAKCWESRASDRVLTVSAICYGIWFLVVYLQAASLHPDPQSSVAILAVGFYAAPMLALFWIAAYLLRNSDKKTR